MSDTSTGQTLPGEAVLSGTWLGEYHSNKVPEQTKVTLIFQQLFRSEFEQARRVDESQPIEGEPIVGSYKSDDGAIGVIYGTVIGNSVQLSATQTTPTCRGSYTMTGQIDGESFSWSFEGQDCLGDEQGKGSAMRAMTSE